MKTRGVYLERWESRERLTALPSTLQQALAWVEDEFDLVGHPPEGDLVFIEYGGSHRTMLSSSKSGGCVFREGVEALIEAAKSSALSSSETRVIAERLARVMTGEYE